MSKAKFYDAAGQIQEVELNPSLYSAAHEADKPVESFLKEQYKTDEKKYGSVVNQMMAGAGLYMQDDKGMGIRATTIQAALDGTCDPQYKAQGGANVREIPASRILFPIAILATVEDKLYQNRNGEVAQFDRMIAQKITIAGTRFEYPILNFERPEQARSSRISQLAEPNLMMVLTTGEKQGYVPTYSLGLQISDQAAKVTTIDFVALSLARQAEVEAAAVMDEQMYNLHMGDQDAGYSALPTVYVDEFDTSIVTAGKITHLAWLKWLLSKRRTTSINMTWMTLETFIKVANREGKPTKESDTTTEPFDERPNVQARLVNFSVGSVGVYIVEPSVVPQDVIVGFDTRYAIRKITNSEAEYSAAEELVMRRGKNMRWDHGYTTHRLYDDAWSKLSLSLKP